MEKEPITISGLSKLKEELIFEKNKVIKLINQELGKEYVKELVLN